MEGGKQILFETGLALKMLLINRKILRTAGCSSVCAEALSCPAVSNSWLGRKSFRKGLRNTVDGTVSTNQHSEQDKAILGYTGGCSTRSEWEGPASLPSTEEAPVKC